MKTLTEMTLTELLHADAAIGHAMDRVAELSPQTGRRLLGIRRGIRAELERRNTLSTLHAGRQTQTWLGLTVHRTGEVSFS
jgi:hypothetical protein